MRFPVGTVAIIGFTLYWSYRGFTQRGFTERYVFSPAHVLGYRQYHRLISAGFLHLNWTHLLLNVFSLYYVAAAIEATTYGLFVLLPVYLGSIVGGNLLSLYLHRYDTSYRALGASGGVCGVIYAFVFLFPGSYMSLLFIPLPSWLYAILFLVLSFLALRNRWGLVGHDAHIGGAIIGLLITTLLRPSIVLASPFLYAVVTALSVVLLVYLYKSPTSAPLPNPFRRAYWRNTWRSGRGQAQRRAKQEQENKETLDRLLMKIARSGLDSLTFMEKRQLKAISKRMRQSGQIH